MKPDREFLRDFNESQRWVERAAKWLETFGYVVEIKPYSLRPTSDLRRDFMDSGDLDVDGKRVEVKRRPDIDFTDASTFPYDTILVDEAYKIDRKAQERLGYVIFNSTGSHACIVLEKSKRYWKKTKKWDKKQRRVCEYYECPVNKCRFYRVS